MAGKLIRRKELYEWVDGFQTDIQRKFDDDHINNYTFNSVTKDMWEAITWDIYKLAEKYKLKKQYDFVIGLYIIIKTHSLDRQVPLCMISRFSFCMDPPPSILFLRSDFKDCFLKNCEYSPLISKRFGKEAWLYRSKSHPKSECCLYLL
ncbi:MAG: hypothetical protein II453_03385 [Alphaproteobacteria bacterium]|jgi:hypothetical protein|nr:hypothetical protein [Alphaproteobacteria bacterium]MBQ5473538.1 hypothetical protein [Lachnospiraceae bacterium]